MTKDQIRNRMKQLRGQLSEEECMLMSSAILNQLFQMEIYQNCSNLLTYISFYNEVNTRILIEKALEDRKKIYAPRIQKKSMEFYELQDLNSLTQSKFGMLEPEPCEERKFTGSSELLLMILPGLAFDTNGNRIGYGAGYYDRYLLSHEKVPMQKVALAYDFQILEKLPTEEFDRRADWVITPQDVIQCNN